MPDQAKLVSAVSELARLGPDIDLDAASRHGPFAALIALCCAEFPGQIADGGSGQPWREEVRWALVHLVQATGLPRPQGRSPEEIAGSITAAMYATIGTRLHLCPLDRADDLPAMAFGPCEIRRFDAASFAQAVAWPRLKRRFRGAKVDANSFARFDWLVVSETVGLPRPIGRRAIPWLHLNLGEDFGAIKPYVTAWPVVVEQAIFCLLLLPWETFTTHPEVEWRGFRVPWVHTVDLDLFASIKSPPPSDTLSWEPDIFEDVGTGEVIETEKPFRIPMEDGWDTGVAAQCQANWPAVERALASPIFNPLVAHFFVKAFTADEIDEFLGHVITIEAALGLESDYGRAQPRRGGGRLSATEKLCRRAAAITGDAAAADQFRALFDLRSAFLHGRPVGTISSTVRNQARSLARRVVSALVAATATSGAQDRAGFLAGLHP